MLFLLSYHISHQALFPMNLYLPAQFEDLPQFAFARLLLVKPAQHGMLLGLQHHTQCSVTSIVHSYKVGKEVSTQ